MSPLDPLPPVIHFSKQEVIVFDPTENTAFSFWFSAVSHPISVGDTFLVSGLNGPVTCKVYQLQRKIKISQTTDSKYQVRVFTRPTDED